MVDSITFTGGIDSGNVTEDVMVSGSGTIQASGSIEFNDSDIGPGIFHVPFVTPIGSSLGTLSVNIFNDATGGVDLGNIDWAYAVPNASVQYLAAGETRIEQFDILLLGSDSEEQHRIVTVTITGANDGPVITSAAIAPYASSEDGALSTSGTISFNDIDVRDTHSAFVSVVASGDMLGLDLTNEALAALLGTTVVSTTSDAAGSVDYAFVGNGPAFQYLHTGETLTLTYTVTVDDDHGGTASETLVVTITGQDDAPVISATSVSNGVIEAGLAGAGTATVTGNAGGTNWVDPDHGDHALLYISDANAGGPGVSVGVGGTGVILGTYGSLTLNGDGTYSYALDNDDADTQALAEGEAVSDNFSYYLQGRDGGDLLGQIQIDITGSNDGPVIQSGGTTTGATTEVVGTGLTTIQHNGSFDVTDIDATDALTASSGTGSVVWSGGTVNPALAAVLAGALTIADTDGSATDNHASIGWTYDATDVDLNFLAQGETLTVTIPVNVADGEGGSATQNIVITLTGTNDTPTLTVGGTDSTGFTATENDAAITGSGTLTVADLDLNSNVVASGQITSVTGALGVVNSGYGYVNSNFLSSQFRLGTGDLTGADGTGVYTWNFDSSRSRVDTNLNTPTTSAFNYLNAGESLTMAITWRVTDNNAAIATQTGTITINGSNDGPVGGGVYQTVDTPFTTVAGAHTTQGTALNIDAGFNLATNADIILSDARAHTTIQAAASGASDYYAFTVTAANTVATFDVDATVGQNDSLLYLYDSAGNRIAYQDDQSVAEVGSPAGTNSLLTYTFATAGTYYIRVGMWFSGIGAPPTETQAGTGLGAGNSYTLHVSLDGAHSTFNGALTESNAALTTTGTVDFIDLDQGSTVTASYAAATDATVTGTNVTLTAGQISDIANGFVVAAGGGFTFNLASPDYLAAGESATAVFTVHGTDGTATATQDVTITLTGSNDGPVLATSVFAGAATEDDAPLSFSYSTTFDDLDISDVHTASISVLAAGDVFGLALTNAQIKDLLVATVTDTPDATGGSLALEFAGSAADFQYLAFGEQLSLEYTITFSDGHGGTHLAYVNVTIDGANDVPVVTLGGVTTGAITEAAGAGMTTVDTSGSFTVTDVDANDILAVTVGTPVVVWSGGTVAPGLEAALQAAFAAGDSDSEDTTATIDWSLNAGALDLDFLGDGETITVTSTITIDDDFGGSTTQDVVVTITGSNDDPVITNGGDTAILHELAGITGAGATAPVSVTGTFDVSDLDANGGITLTSSFQGHTTNYGPRTTLTAGQQAALASGLTFSPVTGNDGTVTWTYQLDNSVVDFLIQSEVLTATLLVTADDGHGGTATTTVAITIDGTNDQVTYNPVGSTIAGTWTEDQAVAPALTGGFNYTDADFQNHGVLVTHLATGSLLGTFGALTASNAANSALDDGSGRVEWSYTLDPGAAQYLAAGETATDVFRVRLIDGAGFNLDTLVTVTVEGTNDAPVLGFDPQTVNGFDEDWGSNLMVGRVFLWSDVDTSDTHSVSSTVSVSGSTAGLTASNGDLLGYLSTPLSASQIDLLFNAPISAFQYLAAGEQITLDYAVTIEDNEGATDTGHLYITVDGRNDAPEADGVTTGPGGLTESDAALVKTGTVHFTDVDFTDVVTRSYATSDSAISATGIILTTAQMDAIAAAFSVAADGSFTFNLASPDYLGQGDVVTAVFTVHGTDTQGAAATQDVTITITGSNDAPVISVGAEDSDSVTLPETNAALVSSGTLSVTDLDIFDSDVVTGVTVTADGNVGALTIPAFAVMFNVSTGDLIENPGSTGALSWSFNSVAAGQFDYLAPGDTLTLTYHITVMDSQSATAEHDVVITIEGTNDLPVIAAASANGALIEDAALQPQVATGDASLAGANWSDIDTGHDAALAIVRGSLEGDPLGALSFDGSGAGANAGEATLEGVYGTLFILANGEYRYVLDNGGASVQALDLGQAVSDVFNYEISDGEGGTATQTITIPVGGANDLATITVTDVSADEADTATPVMLTVAGQVSITDIDTLDAANPQPYIAGSGSVSATGPSPATGSLDDLLTFDAVTGEVSYDRGAFNWLDDGETVVYTIDFQAQSGDDGLTNQSLTITIAGENDAPVAGADSATLQENAGTTINLLTNDSDADLDDTGALSVTGFSVASVTGIPGLTAPELASITGHFTLIGGHSLQFTPPGGFPGGPETIYDRLGTGQSATITLSYMLSDGTVSSTGSVTVTINGENEVVFGTPFDDNPLNGSNFADEIHADTGDDVVFGNSGNDILYGDGGDDTLNGGSNDDQFFDGDGNDSIVGGTGTDVAHFYLPWTDYAIAVGSTPGSYTLTAGGFTDTIATVEFVTFGEGGNVAVADILNDAPVVAANGFAINENVVGAQVLGTVSASDVDAPLGDSFTFAITGGNAAGHFIIDANSGEVSLADGQSLDREAQASYSLTVTATDVKGATGSAAVTVTVGDENDNVPVFSTGMAGAFNEDAALNSVVFTAAAADVDAGSGAIVYSLGGADAEAFTIDAETGAIRLSIAADYEARTSYALEVTATQGATATTQALTLQVNDVNEFAVGAVAIVAGPVNEVTSTNMVIGSASASDGDGTANVSYALVNDAGGRFTINAATGSISTTNGILLDFEQAASHLIRVRATSSDGSQSEANATIAITNVDPENVVGTAANETVNGGALGDVFAMGGGNDTVFGRDGDDTIDGNDGDDLLVGGLGSDSLTGASGTDTLLGGDGNDVMSGGAGASNTMQGGTGDDTYIVSTVGDSIVEFVGEGTDEVQTALSSQTMASNIEVLRYTGATKFLGLGNNGDNVIFGGAASDDLYGREGNDELHGGAGVANTMIGADGNDVYYVEAVGDSTFELAGGGTDEVRTAFSIIGLQSNVENLTFIDGARHAAGVGNDLANVIRGNSGVDDLFGRAGNDTLYGGTGAANTLIGQTGDDIYVVEAAGDSIIEFVGEGTDEVQTALASFVLRANVENLTYTGSGAFTGIGSVGANRLTGGAGADFISGLDGDDTIIGGGGSDMLLGGAGADQFRFNAASDGLDRILDFTSGTDKIALLGTAFAHTATISLAQGAAPIATGSNSTFLYNVNNGILSYDDDGNGAHAAVQIAQLNAGLTLTTGDFLFV